MKNEAWVLGILQAVCNQTVNHSGLNQLIELTQSFAFTYFNYRYKNLGNILLGEDVTLDEMAIDAIAPLFERDESGTFIRIKRAFVKWEPKIETEEQANFFVNRLAAKSTEKYVSELLRQSDPFFSKILKSINYLIERQGYAKKQILGTTYIIENEFINVGSLSSNQFIYDLPLQLFRDTDCMLKDIFNHIKINSDNAAAIPLNALVIKIKSTSCLNFEISDRVEVDSTIEIDTVINNAIQMAFYKLEDGYLKNKKIDEDESSAIKRALYKISIDLRDGGIITGLHKYLIEEIPSLSFDDYRMKYQNIFEYLFKILRKEIIHQLEY